MAIKQKSSVLEHNWGGENMGRQIAIGATRNDLLPVLEQIYKLGYTFWGFNQYAPLADLVSIKEYCIKKTEDCI